MALFTLGKRERVKKQKTIDRLFTAGKSFGIYPLRIYYILEKASTDSLITAADAPLQFGVGVSKRHFKKAVHRNRIKRLLRESWRLQKSTLLQMVEKENICLQVFFIFTGKELPVYSDIKLKVAEALVRLEKMASTKK